MSSRSEDLPIEGKLPEDEQTEPTEGEASGPLVESAPPPPPRSEGSLAWRLSGVIKTIRPHQWVKNVFVLAPVVFAKEIFDPLLLSRASLAFVVFCLLAGAVYTINDIIDVEADRLHPVKRYRPIPSGRVPIGAARVLAVLLVVVSLGLATLSTPAFVAAALAYFVLNIAYSFKLKQVPYVDVGCIAAGFVLRVVGGGFATLITISNYLLVCTALLALFLGFGKRRHEIAAGATKAAKQRASLERYTAKGLDLALAVTAIATIVTYVAYTLDPRTQEFFKTRWLWPSAGFVVLGVWRFLHLVRSRPKAESPTQEMLKDGPFVAIVMIWVILVMWVVYHLRPS